MKKLFWILVPFFLCPALAGLNSRAQCVVTASVTITNLSTNGVFFTVNGVTRTFTNAPLNGTSWVLTNADVTGSGSKTNLFANIGLNPYPLVNEADTGSNTFNLISAVSTNCVNPLVVSMSVSLGSFSYSTQTVSTAIDRRVPYTVEPPAIKTNIVNDQIAVMNDPAATNQVSTSAAAMQQFQLKTNGINFGSAFSSRGPNGGDEQFGSGATTLGTSSTSVGHNSYATNEATALGDTAEATADSSTALGANATATGNGDLAVGNSSSASGNSAIAIGTDSLANTFDAIALGVSSQAMGSSSVAIGNGAQATTNNSTAVGTSAVSIFTNSAAIGSLASNTAPNQIMLGSPGISTVVENNETVQTNLTVGGTVAAGSGSTVIGPSADAIGNSAAASGTNSIALGQGSNAATNNSTAIGPGSSATYSNSTAVDQAAATTATNQVMLGNPTSTTVVDGQLSALNNATVGAYLSVSGGATFTGGITNLVHFGTNNFPPNSDVAFSRYAITTLANGGNQDVAVGTNVFVEVSGPTGAFSLYGFANGRDGKEIVILNQTAQNETIANESGLETTAANRIRTLTGIDMIIFGNSAARFIYNANVNRWIFLGGSQTLHANSRTMNAATQLTQAAGIFQNNCPVALECQLVMRWASGAYQVNVHGNSLGGTTQTVSNMPIYELLEPGDTVQLNGATTFTSDIYTNAW